MSQENVEVVRGARIVVPPYRGGRRRALDERLAIRFPALARLLAGTFMRLSPQSRLRRLILIRRIQQAYAAHRRRDYEAVLAGWDRASCGGIGATLSRTSTGSLRRSSTAETSSSLPPSRRDAGLAAASP